MMMRLRQLLEQLQHLYQRLAQIPRVRKVASFSGYPLFYLFCLVLFGYCTFPYDRLKERLVLEVDNQPHTSPGPPSRLEIDKIGPYWFSGVAFKGVRYISPKVPAPGASADAPPPRPAAIVVDSGHARLSLLPLLIGRTSISFVLDALGGTAEGWTSKGGDDRRIQLDIDRIDVGQIDPLASTLGVPLVGSVNGKIAFTLPGQKDAKASGIAKAAGTVEMSIVDFVVGDGTAKIGGKIALPKLQIGTLDLTAEATDGLLKITKLSATGQDLELAGDGKIALREPMGDSLCDVYLRFKFSDGYRGRSDLTKSLFGAPGSTTPGVFEVVDMRIKASKRADGFYGWHMIGPLKDPHFEPAATGGSGGGGGAAAGAGAHP